ncbi:hypothetical protein GCM10009844_02460 [Nocardioides koreensis]|uniref:DUF559 domain-containing protein n=1 Tax=Nocardioides koreensis TaxID=433651 RepID=A0ABP5KUN4_9ACTN
MDGESWRAAADEQAGLLSRRQLNELGVDRWRVRNQIAAGRWAERSPMVISTTTGPLSREQLMWLGVLHAGPEAVVGGLAAAEVAGLRNWHRDEVTVLIPDELEVEDVPGIDFHRTRRAIKLMRRPGPGLPTCRVEPAILLFGAYQRSRRTAQGVVAAAVQQRLTEPEALIHWVNAMRPLRWAPMFRQVIGDIAGGSQSVAELDVVRMCRDQGLSLPDRQLQRIDADGRTRFTDCEWRLSDGRVLVLEVDGSFHMDSQHWEDDLARQRQLSAPDRLMVRCTARELREEPWKVARDLRRLGVPSRAA